MRIMRSWMFVPGHQQRMIDKAYGLKIDVAMFDIEDGVPPGEKDAARAMMAETLAHPPSEQRLAECVVDLMGAGVVEVFPFQVNVGLVVLGQPLGVIERRRPPYVVLQ